MHWSRPCDFEKKKKRPGMVPLELIFYSKIEKQIHASQASCLLIVKNWSRLNPIAHTSPDARRASACVYSDQTTT